MAAKSGLPKDPMTITRRELLLAALGAGSTAFLAGCVTQPPNNAESIPDRPGPWDDKRRLAVNNGATTGPVPGPTAGPGTGIPPPGTALPQKTTAGMLHIAGISIFPRSAWTTVLGPINNKHDPMNGIKHITVHHEGWPDHPVTFEDQATTIERIESVRRAHTNKDPKHGWSDIGYHFIIDRAGRIWEGRNLDLQGAHVEDCNPHNLGIMCLGNFEEQHPSSAQLASLAAALKAFKAHYQVPMSEILTHQEWCNQRHLTHSTDCPGRNLQAQMARIRTKEVIG